MTAYVNYTYYTTTYGGTAIASADFLALANKSSAFIDLVTMNRAAAYMALLAPTEEEAEIIDKIKMATCAVAEEWQSYDKAGGVITSESVGSHSVSYADTEDKTQNKKLSLAAYPFLAHTGLMFRGFNADEYTSYPVFP